MYIKQKILGTIKDNIHFFIISFVIILSIGYWYFTAPPPGFCIVQNRFITDEEYIKFSTNNGEVVSNEQKIVDGKPSVSACCYIGRSEGGFWSKIFRLDEGVGVSWYYERTQENINEHDPDDKYYEVVTVVNSCATEFLFNSRITASSASVEDATKFLFNSGVTASSANLENAKNSFYFEGK